MTYIGRRFVPQSTIDRRVQQKDDRVAVETAARTSRLLQPGELPKPMTRAERQHLADLDQCEPQEHRCAYCRQERTGRFRRPQERATASGHGWSQGSRMPLWICHRCDREQGTAPTSVEGVR